MGRTMGNGPLLVLAAALALPGAGRADEGLGAEEVVEKVQQLYARTSEYRATFVQTTSHKLFAGRLERAYGAVLFKSGGRMRWEYARPEPKLFIYDGATLWVYEPQVPQAFKATADADRLQRALAFLTGEGKILEQYAVQGLDAKRYGFAGGHVLKLRPKAGGSPFRHVELYVDGKDFHVVRSVVVDHEGNRNRLDFGQPETNTGLGDDLFRFTPPAGVPVIEAPK